jgi:hypothetical protein
MNKNNFNRISRNINFLLLSCKNIFIKKSIHISQRSPLYPSKQVQLKEFDPVTVQSAPLSHGFDEHGSLS